MAGNVEIPNNLIVRAAELCLKEMKVAAEVDFELDKRIPMGAGLGGGSSDAAAVLLTLPRLAGKAIPGEQMIALAAQLGRRNRPAKARRLAGAPGLSHWSD